MSLPAWIVLGLLMVWTGPARAAETARPTLTLFAAASLADALESVADAFARGGAGRPRLSFAASSILAKQIEQGADVHVFVAADLAWMDYLDKRGLIVTGGRAPLLGNRLALIVPSTNPIRIDLAAGSDWLDQLGAGRIAVGDPAHVPAGRYARDALERLGLWPKAVSRLALADNVRGALALVERGEAVAGIVYATDARATDARATDARATDARASHRVRIAAIFPQAISSAIIYPAALIRANRRSAAEQEAATRLYRFLFSPEARTIFEKHGFLMP